MHPYVHISLIHGRPLEQAHHNHVPLAIIYIGGPTLVPLVVHIYKTSFILCVRHVQLHPVLHQSHAPGNSWRVFALPGGMQRPCSHRQCFDGQLS